LQFLLYVLQMPQKSKTRQTTPPLTKDDPNYFRSLVQNCIEAYKKLSNSSLALDYCKISDRKLRVMILNDEEYKIETKNIYAKQRLEEIEEIETLERIASGKHDEDGNDYYAPRDGEKGQGKITGADKDVLNMRFKAAQMKRELRSEFAKSQTDNEQDTVNMLIVAVTQEEMNKLLVVEFSKGSDDLDMGSLIGTKEDVPIGTVGNDKFEDMENDTPEFVVREDGTIEER